MSLNAQKIRDFLPNVLRRIKLRTRLFVTFLIISLVPVITIGVFSYHAYLHRHGRGLCGRCPAADELLEERQDRG